MISFFKNRFPFFFGGTNIVSPGKASTYSAPTVVVTASLGAANDSHLAIRAQTIALKDLYVPYTGATQGLNLTENLTLGIGKLLTVDHITSAVGGGHGVICNTFFGICLGALEPQAMLEVLSTARQLRLTYGVNAYTDFTVANGSGGLTINPRGNVDGWLDAGLTLDAVTTVNHELYALTVLGVGSNSVSTNTVLDVLSTHATVPGLLIRSATASADVALSFYHSVATVQYWSMGIDSDATGKPFVISPNNVVHGKTDFVFDSAGNLGIGKTPTVALDVLGAGAFSENVDLAAGKILAVDHIAEKTGGGSPHGVVFDSRILLPVQPAFSVYPSAHLTNKTGDGTSYTVEWNTERYDVGAGFASNTFTAPVNGIYHFDVFLHAYGLVTGTHTAIHLQLIVAGTSAGTYYIAALSNVGALDATVGFGGGADIYMTAGDTITVVYTVEGTAKTADIAGGVTASCWSGRLVC